MSDENKLNKYNKISTSNEDPKCPPNFKMETLPTEDQNHEARRLFP